MSSSSTSTSPDASRKRDSGSPRETEKLWPLLIAAAAGCLFGGMIHGFISTPSKEPEPLTAAHIPGSLTPLQHELQALLQEAKRAEAEGSDLKQQMKTAISRLTGADFPKAIQRALQLPGADRSELLQALIERWAVFDGSAAMGFAMAQSDPDLRNMLLQTAIQPWIESAPSAALAWIKAMSKGQLQEELLEKFVTIVEQSDPALALTAVEAMRIGPRREALRHQIASRLAEQDITAGMLALLNGRLDHPDGISLRAELASRWIKTDLQGALEWSNQLADLTQRKAFLASLVTAWAATDREAALKWVQQQPSADRGALFSSVFTAWMKTDIEGASAYALAMPRGEKRNHSLFTIACTFGMDHKDMHGVLEMYAHLDPLRYNQLPQLFSEIVLRNGVGLHGGAEILRSLPGNEENQALLDKYLYHWAGPEPDEAGRYIEENGLLLKAPTAAWLLGFKKAGGDMEPALEWARKIPAGEARSSALSGVLLAMSHTDPVRAVGLLEQERRHGLPPEAAYQVVESWVMKDPQSAASWVAGLKDEPMQMVAWRVLMDDMARTDPTGNATRWLETLPVGQVRDIAVSTFAEQALSTDPEGALAWAATIQDPDQRVSQMESLAIRWMHTNRAAATEWINGTEHLSPAIKEWLLRKRAP